MERRRRSVKNIRGGEDGGRTCRLDGKRSRFRKKKVRGRLTELARSQGGWRRAEALPDMEVRLFGWMCCSCCFRRWRYAQELIRGNVDIGWVIHVDQCSETIAPPFTCPSALGSTAQTEHTGDKRIYYLITCMSVRLPPRFCIQMYLIHWYSICSFTFIVPHKRLKQH